MSRAVLALVAALAARPALPAERVEGVTVDWKLDGAVTGGALVLWGASELAADSLAPAQCRWCNPPGFDKSVTESLAWSNRSAASTASDVLALSIPAAFATYDWFTVQDKTSVARDLLVVTEAAALTGLVTQVAKFTAARQRPYAYYGAPTGAADDRLSFWSGHAALTFTVAAASGTVARLDGDPAWPWIYAIGFTAAAGTSYLRLAAEKHWLSDVLVGAAVGTAVGFTVPLLHRKTGDLPVRVGAMPGGVLVFGTF